MTEFLDQLPGQAPNRGRRPAYKPREQSRDLWDFAEELRVHPGKWAVYPRPVTEQSARRTANYIREGLQAALQPEKGFESAQRLGKVYVRYNPDTESPVRRAYLEGHGDGFRAGVRACRDQMSGMIRAIEALDHQDGLTKDGQVCVPRDVSWSPNRGVAS